MRGLWHLTRLSSQRARAAGACIHHRGTEPHDRRLALLTGQAGDTSVFGWQIFALRSGHLAGLSVPRTTLRGCSDYLNLAAADPKKITYSYQPGHEVSPVMTAEALVSRQLLGWPRNHPALVKGAGRVAAHLESNHQRNIYYWYYATQLLHNLKNKDWETLEPPRP